MNTVTTKPIPRDRGTPLVGHLGAFRNDRVGFLQRLAKDHPDVVDLPIGIIRHTVMVQSPALANEILVAKQTSFHKSPGMAIFLKPALGDGLLTSEAPLHEKQRKLLAPAFAHKRVAAYGATMGALAERFVDRLRDGERIDLGEGMMRLTFEIVGKTLFDTDVGADAETVSEAVATSMEVAMEQMSSLIPIPPIVPTPLNLKYRAAVQRLDRVVYRIIDAHRRSGEDRGDVLSMLLEARDEDGKPMSDRQVRDEAMGLFLAGHETTANALAWTFYLLAKHPDVRAKMEAELAALGRAPDYDDLKKLPYTLAVFKESMRLYPPAYLIGRRPLGRVRIGEHEVGPGSIVIVNVMGIHLRADLWPDPERFDPERFMNDREKQLPRCAYMPFGAGARICIGNHFALMEGHVVLATLARRLRFELEHAGPAEIEPLVTLRPKNLRARAELRRPD
ncbi:MAG: cytochrome P450 [Labilithrix sp.]|nr:cytochrome P450 [Labilithrix sp.]MCW5817713.1 cytochrome P450 [Labilithrix sp.]